MKCIDMTTMTSAIDRTSRVNGTAYRKLSDVQGLCSPQREHHQKWSFQGDWKKRVAPVFHSK
jgi:hypothetical protein